MSARTDFAEAVRTDWAQLPALSGVHVIATESELDELDRPTALIRLRSIGRGPVAPMSTRVVSLLLTLISPHVDADRAADQIEELGDAALDYLGPRYLHDLAEVVGYGDRLALDIPLSITFAKE
jgi:hypothetical protein